MFDQPSTTADTTLSLLDDGAPVDGTQSLPELVQYYITQWPRYLELIRATEQAYGAIRSAERELHPSSHVTGWLWELHGRYDFHICEHKTAVIKSIIEFAAVHFGVPGAPAPLTVHDGIEIATNLRVLRDRDDRSEDLDVLGFWRALEERFGGGAGASIAMRDLARNLRRTLHIYSPTRMERRERYLPKTTKKGIEFNLGWGIEKNWAGNGYGIKYEMQNTLRELSIGLQALLPETNPADIHISESAIRGSDRHFSIPADFSASRSQLGLKFFKEKTIVSLPFELAAELMATIEEHDPNGGDR